MFNERFLRNIKPHFIVLELNMVYTFYVIRDRMTHTIMYCLIILGKNMLNVLLEQFFNI